MALTAPMARWEKTMTKFGQKSFSVGVGSDAYRENYDRIFRSRHADHGQALADGEPEDAGCGCTDSPDRAECARAGCGFCLAAEAAKKEEGGRE